jgi:hypothetical protein
MPLVLFAIARYAFATRLPPRRAGAPRGQTANRSGPGAVLSIKTTALTMPGQTWPNRSAAPIQRRISGSTESGCSRIAASARF